MKTSEIKIGRHYLTKVGGISVRVVVIDEQLDIHGRVRFRVKRADNGAVLPKPRFPVSLHAAPPTLQELSADSLRTKIRYIDEMIAEAEAAGRVWAYDPLMEQLEVYRAELRRRGLPTEALR